MIITLGASSSPPAWAQTSSAFPFTLQESTLVSCWFFGVSFTASQGQQVTVQWSQNPTGVGPVSVNFYIAPLTAVQQIWLCDEGPVYSYWNDGALGTANWTAPLAGTYAALIVNYRQYPVSGTISITTANTTSLSATPIGPSMVRRHLQICIFQECEGP